VYAFPRGGTSDIPGDVDARSLSLPVMPSGAAVPMDAENGRGLWLDAARRRAAHGLFDRFGRAHTYLRISVTERCNLRCRYCMPEEGVQLLPRTTCSPSRRFERLAALFVRLGVRKIRLTGGEPLVRRDIDDLVARIGALKARGLERLMMTSNALLLREHMPALLRAGMDAVNLSLDTLRPDRFRRVTGREGCEETIAAIDAAAQAGFRKVKVNAVVMKGVNDDELVDLARAFAATCPSRCGTSSILPFEGNGWGEELQMFPAASIRARLEEQLRLESRGLNDGGAGTAQMYDVFEKERPSVPGTDRHHLLHDRALLRHLQPDAADADGNFRWCLLDEGELDLRAPLRAGATDGDLAGLIEEACAASWRATLPRRCCRRRRRRAGRRTRGR